MANVRLSKNQKTSLYILALMYKNNNKGRIPVLKAREMVEGIRCGSIDPANFRKGMHTLADRGIIELSHLKDLTLCMELTKDGLQEAARIYEKETGERLELVGEDQMTIFDSK